MIRLPLDVAITSILGRKEAPNYRDLGHNMKIKDLFTILGLKGSPMLYHYMEGRTLKIEPERAMVLLDKFDILIDEWEDKEELERDAVNSELSVQIAREPIVAIIEEIVTLEQVTDVYRLRRGMRRLIAKYY